MGRVPWTSPAFSTGVTGIACQAEGRQVYHPLKGTMLWQVDEQAKRANVAGGSGTETPYYEESVARQEKRLPAAKSP